MNIKNKNGVTITILVITIIVMLILFGITFSSATDLLKNSQKNKMKTMLYMVQSRAEILLNDYLFDTDGKTDITEDDYNILGGSVIEDVSQLKGVGFNEETIPSKSEKIYCSWNEATLKAQGIDTENLAQGDTIIIQYNIVSGEVEVASTKGTSIDGKSLHKLGEFD